MDARPRGRANSYSKTVALTRAILDVCERPRMRVGPYLFSCQRTSFGLATTWERASPGKRLPISTLAK